MKRILLIAIIFTLCTSCLSLTSINDFDKRRSAADTKRAVYNQKWDIVYDAVLYVMARSENRGINSIYSLYQRDLLKDQRLIVLTNASYGKAMVIFFTPLNESQTRVEFVESAWFGKIIDNVIKESKYYLEYGPDKYKSMPQD